MLLIISLALTLIALSALLVSSSVGVLLMFFARPFIDTAWKESILLGFKLTELTSVIIPMITLLIIMINKDTKQSLERTPLSIFWLFYIGYVFLFCVVIGASSSIADGANVFFRIINGFVGFYLVQSYFHKTEQYKIFFLALAISGVFPMATGLYETLTGVHWKVTTAEGQIRSIGLYHDAITIRYYGLQTILAVAACFRLNYPKQHALKLFLLGLMCAALVVVFNALSKSGMLCIVLWIALWSLGKRSWMLPAICAGGATLLIPVYFQEINETIYNMFHKELGALSGEVETNRTFAGRWVKWEYMAADWRSFSILQKMFGSGKMDLGTHNDFLQMLFHGGITGLLLYVSLLSYVGTRLIRIFIVKNTVLSMLSLMALGMWLIDSIGLVPSLYSGYQWFVWGVIGLCLREESENKKGATLKKCQTQDQSKTILSNRPYSLIKH